MQPLLNRAEARAIDRRAIEEVGIPGVVLMENAGAGATRLLLEHFRGALRAPVIVGGVGQNGGDAWVVARHLQNLGYRPQCWLIGDEASVRGDAHVNFTAYRALQGTVHVVREASALAPLEAALRDASVVVDGLFGTGLSRPLDGLYGAVVHAINAASRPCFALDLPSGIDADTGQILGTAVRARFTATFAAEKRGLAQHPGAAYAGQVAVVSIGTPAPADAPCLRFGADDVQSVLAPRGAAAHKGTNGHVLVIAGSPGKTGAAVLVGLGALRTGAGLVTIAASEAARAALDQKVVELMTATFASADDALALAANKQAAVVGPGLGLDDAAQALARRLARELPLPAVIDADALTALGTDLACLRTAPAPRVLTPHPREASRLLGVSTESIQRDRFAAASELAVRSGALAVLKGARTVIATPDQRLWVSSDDVPTLGTAGSGDVLSGVIAANFCTMAAREAAWVGVALHASAGKLAGVFDRGVLASEIALAIPRAMRACVPLPTY